MEFKTVVIEYRPRLQSCYVFISFNKNISEDNIKLNVLQKSIILKYIEDQDKNVNEEFKNINLNEDQIKPKHVIFDVSEFFSLDNTSISALSYSGSEIIFRLQTEPNNTKSGSFKTELFTNLHKTQKTNDDKYTIKISELSPYSFTCCQCNNEIFSTKGFKRVLELPSENLDMSDWFCHKHDDCKSTKLKLEPDSDELFYKDYFIIINPTLIPTVQEKNIECKKCKCIIGQKVKNGVKIYNCTINVRDIIITSSFAIFSYQNSKYETPLQDFLYLTRKFINNKNQCFLLPQICKIIYETNTAENVKKYLLIWVLDKNLQILTNKDGCKLKSIETTKLLYRIEDDNGDIYKQWNSEIEKNNISVEEIPNEIFEAGCRHLKLMSEYVSVKYQNVNEFIMTYLDL